VCTITLTDDDGLILLRHPDPEAWRGKQLPETLPLKALLSGTNGLIEAPDTRNIPCIYAISSHPSQLTAGNIFVILGLPKHVLFAKVNRAAAWNLAWWGGLALLVLITSWIGINLIVLRPVEVLLRSAARLADGDLCTRVGRTRGAAEFKQLAQAFDHMAQSLEQRESAQKQTEDALHRLSGQILSLQDDERRDLARELHDATAQSLAALAMNLDLLHATVPGLEAKASQLLTDSLVLANQCTNEVRTMSYLLHPPLLEDAGLTAAVRDLADGFAERSGIRVDLQISEDFGRLPFETELTLFRVLQESLSNVRRHSGSPTASINLVREAKEVWLEVCDRGCGLAKREDFGVPAKPAGRMGVGIPGMKERLHLLGGRLVIESGPHGTSLKAILPLTE
jgi:signal transduction histidine kinase